MSKLKSLFLVDQLNNMKTPKRVNRERVSHLVLENPELFKELIAITFKVDNQVSIKAAWILEWICKHHHLEWMLPHLDEFSTKISTLRFDSSIRACAKICELIATAYFSKSKNAFQEKLTQTHIDSIIETGFDWLISPQKIAVRAYTMTVLYLFGLKNDWIHPELSHLISTKIIHEGKGCKARGKQVLDLIEKHKKSDI